MRHTIRWPIEKITQRLSLMSALVQVSVANVKDEMIQRTKDGDGYIVRPYEFVHLRVRLASGGV